MRKRKTTLVSNFFFLCCRSFIRKKSDRYKTMSTHFQFEDDDEIRWKRLTNWMRENKRMKTKTKKKNRYGINETANVVNFAKLKSILISINSKIRIVMVGFFIYIAAGSSIEFDSDYKGKTKHWDTHTHSSNQFRILVMAAIFSHSDTLTFI